MTPNNLPKGPVSFDPLTRQHVFVPDYFKTKPGRFVSWLKRTKVGEVVTIGARLGIIEWDDGVDEPIVCLASGKISVVNHNIADATLQDTPAQLAIVFE
jgi:hypothetical protein